MRWKFTLIDRYDNHTVVDEPVGWDAFTLKIKRHSERHGTYRELQTNSFQFHGAGGELLRTEHELYGIRGNYRLKIDGYANSAWSNVYMGQLGFDNYKFTCDQGCFVTVDLDQIGPQVKFINRFDQKVDLSSEFAFDGTTELTDYENITKEILLPSKAILLRGNASNTELKEYNIHEDAGWYTQSNNDGNPSIASTGTLSGALNVPFGVVDVDAIKDFDPSGQIDFFNVSHLSEYIPELIYNNPNQDLNCTGTEYTLEFKVKGRIKNLVSGSGTSGLTLNLKNGLNTFGSGATTIQSWVIRSVASNIVYTVEFDIDYSGTVTLAQEEKLWLNFFLQYFKSTDFPSEVVLEIDPETYFKASVISKCDPSTAKFYLINETVSRVMEAITDNALKLYSEWYGRTDSEPYDFPDNGCGSLKGLSIGLLIRKSKMADDSEPKMFLSMLEIFESLSAVDNIGVGFEGEDKVRIENWKWFYQDTVVFKCRNIDKLEKITNPSEHWSKFLTGYEKWEAEDYNGLDEFLTKREYRTALSEVQNELSKLCKFIASGYAIEVTRRKQNDTKDWRFDNDTFLLCLSNLKKEIGFINGSSEILITSNTDDYAPGDSIELFNTVSNNSVFTVDSISHPNNNTLITVLEATVNEGLVYVYIKNLTTPTYDAEVNNVTSADNILDPGTIFNFRISPARNAMRWFDRVTQCYRNITNADELIFSAGDGNFIAEGILNESEGCILESGLLVENQNLNLTVFDDDANGKPILHPERVKYSYPLSFSEYNEIKSQPYGLIYYQCRSEKGEGWIDEIEYLPEEGLAKFTLIPKTNN